MKNWWLYVLKLEQGKYYVGITSQTPEERFEDHVKQRRSAYWTMQYKPIEIYFSEELGQISKEDAEAIENLSVRKYMRQFGLNNVRGGDLPSNLANSKTEDYSKLFGYFMMKHDVESLWIMLALILLNIFWASLYFLK